ncbi:MAG TPA: NADP transhydrogenase subunit alpha [Chloroflexi bacterium]|nr:NADP transhydrogenase subunit alpha [Chloroflexota bacterium]
MTHDVTITVLGGGNGAFAAAADLTLKGATVHLLEVPELAPDTIAPVQTRGGIELVNSDVAGVAAGFAPVAVVTDDPEAALAGADMVLYVVPAYAERRFTEFCLPYFRPEQLVVLFCGSFGGALEVASLLSRRSGMLPTIAETEQLVYGAFKQNATTVKVGGLKAGLACAALPATQTRAVLERLQPLFSGFQTAPSVLHTSLRNLNPVVHAPVSLLNAGRTAADKPKWRYYWEGVTEPVGRVVERVDAERVAVGQALGMALPGAREVLLSWYEHQGARGRTLGEVMSTNPAYEIAWAPQTLNHRFLTEDIPFGLVPLEALGRAIGVSTPVISALITLGSELVSTDFRTEGRTLARLGLEGLSSEEIRRQVETG